MLFKIQNNIPFYYLYTYIKLIKRKIIIKIKNRQIATNILGILNWGTINKNMISPKHDFFYKKCLRCQILIFIVFHCK